MKSVYYKLNTLTLNLKINLKKLELKKIKKKNRRASPYKAKNRKKNLVEEKFFFFIFNLNLVPKA